MLTIVLPVAGRSEFTPRFLAQADKLSLKVLTDISPERVPFKDWALKIVALLEKVETPFAMLADNDDLLTSALQYCAEFLCQDRSYVCCSGRVQGFWLWPDLVHGPHSATSRQYSPYDTPAEYSQDSPNARVLAGFANSWSYYAVYRTKALQQIWREVCALNFTNLQVHEKFCAMRTLTLGKTFCLPKLGTSLYRQHGTSHGAQWEPPNLDVEKVLTVMSAEGVSKAELAHRWREWYMKRERYFQGSLRKTAKQMFPTLAWYVQNRHRYLPHRSLPSW